VDLPPRVRGSIDEPTAGERIDGDRLRIRGWVFDERGPLDRVLVVIGDLPPVTLSVGQWRPDVASAFAQFEGAGASGFHCDVDLRGAPAGRLQVALLARGADGEWHQPVTGAIEVVGARVLGAGRRPAAAFTIVQNEPVMLPFWLQYYGRHFAAQDLYVLDHDSTDGSVEEVADRCNVIPVHRTASFDHRWLRGAVEAFQAFLLESYGAVLFTEVDEFVVTDPRHYAGLADYIARLASPAARCVGFNVVHQPDEPPLTFDEPILAQRSSWHASREYSKRLLSRVPLAWSEGFHDEYNAPDDPPDPALMLVHLHRVDYELCLARHRSSAGRNWSAEDVVRGDGSQNRVADGEDFDRWFYHGPDLDAPREVIPEHLRRAL
jgi:hypothetical protein